MKPVIRTTLVYILALLVAVLLLVGRSRQVISVLPVGTTNTFNGFTNGRWVVYCVTNHTTNSFSYAGAKIEIKTDNGWAMDPAVTPTELGWLAPPTRVWHDGNGILPGGGSFHIFFRAPENGAPWKASLRFFRRNASRISPAVRTDPGFTAAAVEAAGNILDYRRPYDVRCPQ